MTPFGTPAQKIVQDPKSASALFSLATERISRLPKKELFLGVGLFRQQENDPSILICRLGS